MGSIISGQPELDNLHFKKMRVGKPALKVDVLQVDDRTAVVRHGDGQFTILGSPRAMSPNGNMAMLGYGADATTAPVLAALVSFGAISQAEMDAHQSTVAETRESQQRRSDLRLLTSLAERLGRDRVSEILSEVFSHAESPQ